MYAAACRSESVLRCTLIYTKKPRARNSNVSSRATTTHYMTRRFNLNLSLFKGDVRTDTGAQTDRSGSCARIRIEGHFSRRLSFRRLFLPFYFIFMFSCVIFSGLGTPLHSASASSEATRSNHLLM